MLPVSPAFLEAVRGSHQSIARARVVQPGQTGANLDGRDLQIVDGSVTLDATANIRGTCDLVVKEDWPNSNSVLDITPYGTEIQISRGIVFGNGAVLRAPLGIYRLHDTEQDEAPAGTIRLTGTDRMGGIIESELEVPVSFSSGQTVGAVMNQLVWEVYPNAVIEWDDATEFEVLGRELVAEQDRFGFLDQLVTSHGKVWYWDYRGVLVIKSPPDPNVPVFTVDAGARGVLVSASRRLTREGVYNAVVATGEALDNLPPAIGIARDLDPASVTYYFGDFGKVPYRYTSPFILTNPQAEAAAATQLLKVKGLPKSVDFSMVPNPALEPLDPIELVYPIDLSQNPHQKIEHHILDQIVIGLGPESAMMCATRQTTNTGV